MKKRKFPVVMLTLFLLITFLYATYMLSKKRVEQTALLLPVQKVSSEVKLSPAPVSELESYRSKRESTRQEDIKTLQALLDSGIGNASFLADTTNQLADIVACREAEIALEGALTGGGFSPCLAVVSPGSVTVIVSANSLTRAEAALIQILCEKHTEQDPQNIRIMTNTSW